MWIIRAASSIAFLSAIIFTIPLAFDVGGRTCGLAFSLSLTVFYFLYSALRLATKDGSRFQYALVKLVGFSQWLIIATLLIWSLNKFSVDSDNSSGWAEKAFSWKTSPKPSSFTERLFGRGGLAETFSIGAWDALLRWSTPFFQIAEGFCSLLVIQAAGQITRWLVNQESGDTWMIILLIFSGSTISGSAYFLWRITTFPQIDNTDAILIGCAITAAIFLGGWGIGSGRGNPVESSLLFAYITLCIYQIFTDYMPSSPSEVPPIDEPALPPLPPIIMASYTTLMHAFSTLPSTIHSAFNFMVAVVMTITPSVIISLAYRVFVMYAAARIIPAVRESGARALSQEPSLEDSDGMAQILGGISWFSPSILIAVYTSLLMQHFASNGSDGAGADWWRSQGGNLGGNLWRWINLALTLGCYTIELWISRHDEIRLTSHWKTD